MAHKNQIFFDISGRRRKVVNALLLLLVTVTAAFFAYIAYYAFQLEQINKLAHITENQPSGITKKPVLLYTDNQTNAYPIANDKIEDLGAIIIPKYFVSDNTVATPANYQQLVDDITFISKNRSTTYDKYFLLSSTNYSQLPLERSGNRIINRQLPQYIGSTQMDQIIVDLVNNHADGLVVELELSALTTSRERSTYATWLGELSTKLEQQNMSLNLSLKANDIMPVNQSIINAASLIYVSFDLKSKYAPQLDSIERNDNLLNDHEVIYELPTVTTQTDIRYRESYIDSIDYQFCVSNIIAKQFTNRSVEPVNFRQGTYSYNLHDSILAYNIIKKLSFPSAIEHTRFSIANPGYEEYTTWKLIADPYDRIRNNYLLSENTIASLDIKLNGQGQVYNIDGVGTGGVRKLEFDENGRITSSILEKQDQPPTVNRSGKVPKKIALTFDDGPNPIYTRKVLDILDSKGVKGTFFLIGENVLAYPEVAREIVDRGHEVENHTYSHPVFSKLDMSTQINQIKANTQLIENVTGQKVQYFRKPYSENVTISTTSDVSYLSMLKDLGLSASEYDIDSKDWLLDTPQQVVDKVKGDIAKSEGDYSQILLHDAHENPKDTLVALPQIIDYIQSQNIEIVRVDQLAEKPNLPESITTKTYRALQGKNIFLYGLSWLSLIVLVFAIVRYAGILCGALTYQLIRVFNPAIVKIFKKVELADPKLAIIIACYNEEKVIARTLDSMLKSSYQNFKIVVVNDGSSDRTAEIVESYTQKDRRIQLINVPNGGKAEALGAAVKQATNKWLVFCDADTIFDRDALLNFVKSISLNRNIGAVAGKIIVGNDINWITRAQVIDYGSSHLYTKSAQDVFNTITVVPGAIGLWNRKALSAAGWFTPDTLAEDADTTMSVVGNGNRVRYRSNVTAKTEAPHTLRMLFKQRTRWQLGNMQALIKHRRGFLNPRYGLLGVVGIPMFYIDIINTIMFPFLLLYTLFLGLVKIFDWNYITNGYSELISHDLFLIISISVIILELIMCLCAIIAEPKSITAKLKLFGTIPYYLVFYKLFLSYATLVAFLRALRGTLQAWGHLIRTATVK